MPPYPGEERLVTVFADLHYYFAQPTLRPVLQRFDKASYFYIYYNSTRHTSRIEIANNPGTPDQDAVNGYIDACRIVNSFKFPTFMTLTIDDVAPQSPSSPKTGRDPEEWHLSGGDPRDPSKTKYKLHTIDVYFWAQDDAKLVLECFKKLLPSNQLDITELEPEQTSQQFGYSSASKSHEQSPVVTSPVVQNLENLAFHDPAYNGQDPRGAASPTTSFASHNLLPPPPPLQQLPSTSPALGDLSTPPGRQTSVESKQQPPANFAPIPYNPAAPAAPEPIAHREKTPPPEDLTTSPGLSQGIRHDIGYVPGPPPPQGGYQIGQGPPNTFGGGYASPPLQAGQSGYGGQPSQQHGQGYHSPPPPPVSAVPYAPVTAASSFSSPPPQAGFSYGGQSPQAVDPRSSMTSNATSFGPGATSTISPSANQGIKRQSTAAENYVPPPSHEPVMTPGTQFYGSLPQGTKPLAHVQPQYADYLSAGGSPVQQQQQNTYQPPPPGGYSEFSYGQGGGQSAQQGLQGGGQYDVHQQVYRPTEQEASAHGKKHSSRPSAGGNDGRKPSAADRVEKGAKSFFKKLEKKIG